MIGILAYRGRRLARFALLWLAVAATTVILSGAMQTPAYAAATPMDWSSVVRQALPAVVDISIETLVTRDGVQTRQREVGTGFLIDPNGTIVTNRHVIEGAFRIIVTRSDGKQYQAQLIGAGAVLDIAVLKIHTKRPLPYLAFADSSKAAVGDPVIVIGNPLGLGTSVSSGIISAEHRNLMNTPLDDYIQTDAAINHGNSGGPMLDRDGKVVAVATILVTNSTGEGSNGLGFAISADQAALTVRRLLDPQAVPLGWIGVQLQEVTPALKTAFHLQHLGGFVITQVDPGGPADEAGLQPGDVITRVGDLHPEDSRDLLMAILQMPLGTRLPVVFERGDKPMQADVTVAPWTQIILGEKTIMNTLEQAQAAQAPDLGLILAPITGVARRLYKINASQGVLVAAVDPASDAFTDGIVAGDVIERIQDQVVTTPDQAMSAAREAMAKNRFIALLVAGKDGSTRWVGIYSGHALTSSGAEPLVSSLTRPNPSEAQAGAVVQGQTR